MARFQDLITGTRNRFESWLATNLPKIGVATGIGVTAWSIGATLGQLTTEAQVAGWGAAIAILSAELGKEFVVGLVERIRDEKLGEEDVARLVQVELDKGLDLPDLRRLLDEVQTLPTTLEHVMQLNNAHLLKSLQADLAAYPRLISIQTAKAIYALLAPQLEMLSQSVSHLDAKSERILAILTSFSDPTDLAFKARVAITDEIIRRVHTGFITLPDAQVQHLEQTRNALTRTLLNLPARRYTRLVGREEEVEKILQKLRTSDPTSPPVIAITGLGGIGKTALAYEIVERAILEGLFDGLVWESAKPEELEAGKIRSLRPPALSFESLVSAIARQLGYDALLQLPPSELQNRIRHILRTDSFLIVVDNLETVEAYEELARQLHELLSPSQSPQPSRALLTSRERLTGIPHIYDHYIRGLSKPASMEFIEQEAYDRGAPGILQAGQQLLDRIFKVTYGMPLAMKLIISQFIAGIPLDTELDRLEGAKEEDLYEFIYMRLWFKLSIPAQKVLIATAAFASSVARFMLQPVSKTIDDEFEAAIPELVRMSLIEPSDHPTAAQRRYSIHPITRWFINAPLKELWEQQKADSQAT